MTAPSARPEEAVSWPTAPQNKGRPLAGVKVLDLSRVLAGPFCSMILADLGADVIKVEPPGGDEIRRWGPPFHPSGNAVYYLAVNRNKFSLSLDLTVTADRDLLFALLRQADVLIHNYTDRVAQKLGLVEADIARENPRLLIMHISGYGQADPNRPGYDVTIQAMSGLMSVTGAAEGDPIKAGVPIADLAAGLFAVSAVTAALYERRNPSGAGGPGGRRLEVSLYDSALAMLTNQAMGYLVAGQVPTRLANDHPNVCPYGAYHALDGLIVLAVATDRHFRELCNILGLEHLALDGRFADNASRVQHRAELTSLLEERLRERSIEEWRRDLDLAGIPNGPVRSVADALHASEAMTVTQVTHPSYGDVPQILSPIRIDGDYLRPYSAPPLVDEHGRLIRE
jgi:crotonobetainyl-CoA:carnitine CoA-transferase CaiB-like acyl-CoA transferase